jgi:hypothetical protein
VNRDDRVLAIVLAAEHFLGLAGIHLCGEIVEGPAEIVGDRLTRCRPLDKDLEGPRRGASGTR